MAGGIDHVYPPEHDRLAKRIIETGALVSECPMGMEPTSRHFPRRNRLISGLARGVVLVEAATRSGGLITARYALEQGREAMACPGAPEDPRSGGCNQLIRDGAALIRDADDVLEALAGPRTLGLAEPGREFAFDDGLFDDTYEGLDYDAADYSAIDDFGGADDVSAALADQILRLLGRHPVEIDEIARQCGASPSEFSLTILELDLAGRVEILPGGLIASAEPDT
jgi:DNA processing protein